MRLIKKIRTYIRFYVASIYCSVGTRLFTWLPIKKNRVVIFSFNGKGYGDSGKYIADMLLNTSEEIEIFWSAEPCFKDTLPKGIKYVRHNSIKMFYIACTARIWINNMRFHNGFHKRKGQFYIQLWHSSLRLKKIEADAGKELGKTYIKTAQKDSKMIDIMTSGAKFSTQTYKRAFWYDGEILECGTPRADLFFDTKKKLALRQKICQKYHIDPNKKIVLYAPTFRKNSDEKTAYVDTKELCVNLGDRYAVLVRSHPISKYDLSAPGVIDVTKYPDMQELICATDFLVTDYSGCCFDALINNTPCILHTPDLTEYLAKERGLYFSFDELPFPQTKTEADLSNAIRHFSSTNYQKETKAFSSRIGLCEKGAASKTIADIIITKCKGNK